MADANDERRAGGLMIRDLALFNRSVVYFEQVVHPEVSRALADLVQTWSSSVGWKHDLPAEVEDIPDGLWVAPADWLGAEGETDRAWFSLDYLNPERTASYVIADLCGVGQTEVGFRFMVEPAVFGGRKKWRNLLQSKTDLLQRLNAAGFMLEKESLFRPVTVNLAQLAAAWEEEDYAQALGPFQAALAALHEAKPHFDALLQ